MLSKSWFAAVAALLVFESSLVAATYIVDVANGPGTDFVDLRRAIASARDGDVLLVRRGSYGSIEVTGKGLTIVGNGAFVYDINIHDCLREQRVAIVGMDCTGIFVTRADGPVVLQDVPHLDTMVIEAATDVRVRNLHALTHGHIGQHTGFGVTDSRVEVVRSTFQAPGGWSYGFPGTSVFPGGEGVFLVSGRLHWVHSEARGGHGVNGNATYGYYNSGGGPAIHAMGQMIVAGRASLLRGGDGGLDYTDCSMSAAGGVGIRNDGPPVEWSNATIEGGWSVAGATCAPSQAATFAGTSTSLEIDPADPTLDLRGLPHPNGSVRFLVEGPPGALATLWLGRRTKLQQDLGIRIEELAERTQVVVLGAIPTEGMVTFEFHVPGSWSLGSFACAQAEVVLPGSGEIRRTNSIPLIVR